MPIIRLTSTDVPELDVYCRLTETQLRNRLHSESGVFIAESPKVIRTALGAGYEPLSLLCEERHLTGDAADIVEHLGERPIFTGSRELLAELTGYTLTRGVLCAMRRPTALPAEEVCRNARRVAVIDSVADTTNIGAIFRSAAALGMDAVLLPRASCGPLNRRSIRVSMGSVFLVPWTWIDDANDDLHRMDFQTAAMALKADSIPPRHPALQQAEKLAVIPGTEGDGLAQDVIDRADHTVCIPMAHGVDSLNVAAAAAIIFWEVAGGR